MYDFHTQESDIYVKISYYNIVLCYFAAIVLKTKSASSLSGSLCSIQWVDLFLFFANPWYWFLPWLVQYAHSLEKEKNVRTGHSYTQFLLLFVF